MLFSYNTLLNTRLNPIIGTILAPRAGTILAISNFHAQNQMRMILIQPKVIHRLSTATKILSTGYPQPPWGCASARTSQVQN